MWHTLSRSYGVNLPSSLTTVLSNASVFSTRPPESVSGTVSSPSTLPAAFLGSVGSIACGPKPSTSPLGVEHVFYSSVLYLRDCAWCPPPGRPTLLRPRSTRDCRFRNINLIPIGYAVRLHLRGRLTLPGLSLDRKPWAFGDKGFHLVCRYSCQHSHFLPLHQPSPAGFTAAGTLP